MEEFNGIIGNELMTLLDQFKGNFALTNTTITTNNNTLTIDIQDIIDAISVDTRIVVLLNPNNPIGNVYTKDELEQVIARAKEVGAIVIVDEAYHYFYPNTFLEYALNEENVIVLRTFSKLMSIAACRLGVIISNPEIIQYVKNGRLTFDVNSIALLFGERLLDNPHIIDQLISSQAEGKEYTLKQLQASGYECRDCRGNFIFIKTKNDANVIANRLKQEKKILVHAYGNPLLKDYIRVSVGSANAMKVFLEGFFQIDK